MLLIYAFDLDGTITNNSGFGASRVAVPWWIIWVALYIYRPKIKKEIKNIINYLKSNGVKIVIITRRPPELENITRKFLNENNIIVDNIFFIGNKKNSLEEKIYKVKEVSPFVYIDNNKVVVERLLKEGLNAVAV